MHTGIHWLAAAAGLLPLTPAHGQQADEVRVIRAAIEFVRDSGAGPHWLLPREPIVIDAEAFRASPALGDDVAREIGARRSRIGEERQCDELVPGRRRTCTIRGNATVVSYSQPLIQDDTAQVAIGWWYQAAPGLVGAEHVKLALVRRADGRWEVTQVLERGMT